MTLPASASLEHSNASTGSESVLSDRQRAFATRFLLDYDTNEAAKAVGLPGLFGQELLREPTVARYIQQVQAEREKLCLIGKDFAATLWLNVLPMLRGDVPVPFVTKNGSELTARKFFANEYIRALTEISQISGLTKPLGTGNTAPVNIQLNFAGLAALDLSGLAAPRLEVTSP